MKTIKKGKPYRKHKCRKCKAIFVYRYNYTGFSELVYCPECHNYLDFHFFDKKISEEEYQELEDISNERK